MQSTDIGSTDSATIEPAPSTAAPEACPFVFEPVNVLVFEPVLVLPFEPVVLVEGGRPSFLSRSSIR